MNFSGLRFLFLAPPLLASTCRAQTAHPTMPAPPSSQGKWDGKTMAARLEGPYEDPRQEPPPFGVISYFSQPWRAYMDTWPAARWRDILATALNGDEKTLEAQAQVLEEAGFRHARLEVGWGNLDFEDKINAGKRDELKRILAIYKRHGLRPLFLLNAHHGFPVPLRSFDVELRAEAPKGARTLQLRPQDAAKIRVGYTGCANVGSYKAAFPLFTRVQADGTAHLSAPLPEERKAGRLSLQELKYQPFQGIKLQDGTSTEREANESVEGWRRYAQAVGELGREVLGTPSDSGFDIEVWNELTFGSDFLEISRYYDPPRQYAEEFSYRKTRAWSPRLRPDAQLEFESKGYTSLLPITVDFFNDARNGFKGVRVNSGFSNQWPWNSGASLWDGQSGLDKHYYTSSARRISSPASPLDKPERATVDALGRLDGKKAAGEWHAIEPGSNFVPSFSTTFPESTHSGLKTETLQRDLFPDSRRTNTPAFMGRYGRYTHNGDFQPPRYWQTEVNYDRIQLNRDAMARVGAREDDPRLIPFNNHLSSKHLLRQAVFHGHKGFERMYFFSTNFGYLELGLFPPTFFEALEKFDYKLTPQVRATLPAWPRALGWISNLLSPAQNIIAPRQLRVHDLVEHKPRLVFAGDGSPAHPSKFHRDFFAFLPFQISAQKFAIPFYVVTPDAVLPWDEKKSPLDPTRYDMPPQDFDVSIGNIAGRGAKISAYDPLLGRALPVQVLASTPSTLRVRLTTVDYPRFLVVEEAKAGPQILEPRLVASGPDEVTLSWKLNRAASAVRVSYGRDWMNRGANEISIRPPRGQTLFSLRLPVGQADIVAARVRVEAEGLSVVWPRWDEDPQGQATLPDARPRAASAPPSRPRPDFGTPTPLRALANIPLPQVLALRDFTLRLPAGAGASGQDDERTITIGAGANAVTVRARYLVGGAANADDSLPFQSATDVVSRRAVMLSGGQSAILSDYTLAATAYPGVSDLRRRYLQVLAGADSSDLLLVSATGTVEAMGAHQGAITAIFASLGRAAVRP